MTVLQHERFNQESEEYLEQEEHAEMVGEADKPVTTNVDPTYRNQDAEGLNKFDDVNSFKYQIVNKTWTPIDELYGNSLESCTNAILAPFFL